MKKTNRQLSSIIKVIIVLIYVPFLGKAQLKVHETGTVSIGTITGGYSATLNLYATDQNTFFARGNYTMSECVSIKSSVNRDDAITFAGCNSSGTTFWVYGNGNVWNTTGILSSDSSLKENIGTITNPRLKLLQLNGFEYNLKNNKKQKHMGFLAQDVEKLFPEVVYTNGNGLKGIAYTELIPVIVEAMKEQQSIIEKLTDKIETLESNKLENKVNSSISVCETQSARLAQNIPNPFNTTTRVNIYLPIAITSAKLYIYNMQGSQIKVYTIPNRGNTYVTIESYTLEAGMYLYSLIADGKEVDTKRMILTD
jgi:hypothetical protein